MQFKKKLLALAVSGISCSTLASDVDFLFVVDESGSMGGEHTFLQTFVPDLSTAFSMLTTPLSTSYGLVGYGQSANGGDPRQHLVGGGNFGTAAQFVTSANNLETSGGTEDGYEAMLYGLNNLQFTATQAKVVILVTDEDRDNTDAAATLAAVQQALTTAGASWSSILNQAITSNQTTQAIGTDGTVSYIADGAGGFTTESGYNLGSAFGTTAADYSNPTLATGGCVADLNLLRAGGATATSFAAAFLNCIQVQVQQQLTGGDDAVLTRAAPMVGASLATVLGISNRQLSAIGHRIHERRTHAALPGIQVAGLNFLQNAAPDGASTLMPAGPLGGGASADGLIADSRLAGFVSVSAEQGDMDQSAGVAAFDYDVHGLTAGVDYRLREDTLIGASVSYHRTNSDLAANAGNIDIEHYGAAVYASKTLPSDYYIDGTVSYTVSDLSTLRNVPGGQATASTDGSEWAASVTFGRDFKREDMSYGPYIGARYVSTTIDPYQEAGVGAVNVNQQSVDGWTVEAGARLSKTKSIAAGVLEFGGSLTLVHKLDDDSHTVTTSLANGSTLNTAAAGTDRTYLRLGLNLKADLKKNTQMFARYDTLLDHDQATAHAVQVGVRVGF